MSEKRVQRYRSYWGSRHVGGLLLGFALGALVIIATGERGVAATGCNAHFDCAEHLATNYPEGYECANGEKGVYSHCRWEGTPSDMVLVCVMDCGGIDFEEVYVDAHPE